MYILGPFLSTFYPPISPISQWLHAAGWTAVISLSKRPKGHVRHLGSRTWRSNKPRMNTWFTWFWHILLIFGTSFDFKHPWDVPTLPTFIWFGPNLLRPLQKTRDHKDTCSIATPHLARNFLGSWAVIKTLMTFYYTGGLIGILVMAHYDPYRNG